VCAREVTPLNVVQVRATGGSPLLQPHASQQHRQLYGACMRSRIRGFIAYILPSLLTLQNSIRNSHF
jgi:hypothetical protein